MPVEREATLNIGRTPFPCRIAPVAFGDRADFGPIRVNVLKTAGKSILAAELSRVSRRIGLRYEAAERQAADDRLDDPERVAEPFHVVAPLGEVPRRRIVSLA